NNFNTYFSTVAKKIRRHLSTVPFDLFKLVNFVKSRKNDQEVNFSVPVITISQVIKTIMKINPHKASGIDKISARLLRIVAPVIAPSITRIINMSLSTGKFPSRWKTAMVTPLYKKGTECDPSNYRPISVLPILSKVIERHFHDSLYAFLNENNLSYTRQSGFRRGHSTETTLIKIIDELLFNLDKDKVSGMVLIDYCKAFDMVDHELLLKKLEVYGIVNHELQWCQSYLLNRKQVVRLGGKMSSEVVMKYGVPQGSILGPLFFILFINDLPLHVTSQIDLYADDTTIIDSSDFSNISNLELSLNSSVSEVQHWANANKLSINESKTKVLLITGKRLAPRTDEKLNVTLNNKILDSVYSAPLLGLDIDKLLSFDDQIEKVCKKLASRIAVLRKIRKRAARTVMFADRQAPSVAQFNELAWIPFYEQCKIDKCAFFYKRIHNNLPSYLGDYIILNNVRNSRNTRYANFNAICPKYNRETEGGRTFLVTATKLWNSIPLNIRKADSLNCFKNNLRSNILKDQQLLHHFTLLPSLNKAFTYLLTYLLSPGRGNDNVNVSSFTLGETERRSRIIRIKVLTKTIVVMSPIKMLTNLLPDILTVTMFDLINKQECFIRFKARARSASGFRSNKTRPASVLNGFKHDYRFNRYTALIIFFFIKNTNEDTTTIDTALLSLHVTYYETQSSSAIRLVFMRGVYLAIYKYIKIKKKLINPLTQREYYPEHNVFSLSRKTIHAQYSSTIPKAFFKKFFLRFWKKEFSKTGGSTIIKNVVYQNHFIKSKSVFEIFPFKPFKELRGVVQFRNYPTKGSNNQNCINVNFPTKNLIVPPVHHNYQRRQISAYHQHINPELIILNIATPAAHHFLWISKKIYGHLHSKLADDQSSKRETRPVILPSSIFFSHSSHIWR
ncbi:Hypothetical predicted protein, partial [Paramuricea clavata]